VSFEWIVRKELWLLNRIFLSLIPSVVHFPEIVNVVDTIIASEITLSFMETDLA
jgi:hypothetical protein